MRRFKLHRKVDETGVSGTGLIAEGVQFTDGTACLRWRTRTNSTGIYDSMADLEKIHGHNGQTEVIWVDSEAAKDFSRARAFKAGSEDGSSQPPPPGEVVPRKSVLVLARAMELKLQSYDECRGFDGWASDTPLSLLERLQEEMLELKQAFDNLDVSEALDECADVANFTMMIFDNLSKKKT